MGKWDNSGGFLWENGIIVDILETIATSSLKILRCRQLIQ